MQTNFNGKLEGKVIGKLLQSCDMENTEGCYDLDMLPLLLPQTGGPYTSFMNHHLLYTELHSTNSNQNICGSLGTDVHVDVQIL